MGGRRRLRATSPPANGGPPAPGTAPPGFSVRSSRPLGPRRGPRGATSPRSTHGSRVDAGRTRRRSRSRTQSWTRLGTCSATAPSARTPVRSTSSAVTIPPSRQSGSSGGSSGSATTSPSRSSRHNNYLPSTSAAAALPRVSIRSPTFSAGRWYFTPVHAARLRTFANRNDLSEAAHGTRAKTPVRPGMVHGMVYFRPGRATHSRQ